MNTNEICKNVAIHNTLQNNIFYKFMIPLAILFAIFFTYYFRSFYINDFLKQILLPIIILLLSCYIFYQLALSTMNQNLYMKNLNNPLRSKFHSSMASTDAELEGGKSKGDGEGKTLGD